jgi:hypothetical protein
MNGGKGLAQDAPKKSEESSEALVETAQKMLRPYSLACKHCDWWSMYLVNWPVGS